MIEVDLKEVVTVKLLLEIHLIYPSLLKTTIIDLVKNPVFRKIFTVLWIMYPNAKISQA